MGTFEGRRSVVTGGGTGFRTVRTSSSPFDFAVSPWAGVVCGANIGIDGRERHF